MSNHEIAITPDTAAQLNFEEDLDIFRIHTKRIHRKAIDLDMAGLDAHVSIPDIEKEAAAAADEADDDAGTIEDAWIDLYKVAGAEHERTDDVTRAIRLWREGALA